MAEAGLVGCLRGDWCAGGDASLLGLKERGTLLRAGRKGNGEESWCLGRGEGGEEEEGEKDGCGGKMHAGDWVEDWRFRLCAKGVMKDAWPFFGV